MDKTKSRIWELDALRGFCILWVIVVHLVFDLGTFLGVPLQLGPVFTAIQSYGGTVFVVLSGLCATLGHRSFRRGAVVFGCGMVITLVTLGMTRLGLADSSIVIWFGVLHLLGVCMMLYPLLRRLPTGVLAGLGAAMVLAGYWLLQRRFDVQWLFPLGVVSHTFQSSDYFPLLPHLGWFMLGVALGRTAYAGRTTRFPNAPAQAAPLRFLQACGRHSLWIYLVHQPLLYGLIWLIGLLR